MKFQITKKGVTYLEVIFIVLSLMFFSFVILQQAYHAANVRNTRRQADVLTISTVVYGYIINNETTIPAITHDSREICQTGYNDCGTMVNLSILTDYEEYIDEIPIDPLGSKRKGGTGYFINYREQNRVKVTAAYAERGEKISISR